MEAALSIRNLKKTYNDGVTALNGVSFDVKQGDFMALLGPNGAGKSTTIGIISSLINKTDGKVFIFGDDIDKDFANAKRNIGIVPQEFNFNMFEKVGNILRAQAGYFGIEPTTAAKNTEKYLKLLDIWEKEPEISRTLSGGMKRRLMIARALVHQPRLLILDEPTAGIDIELRRYLWDFLIDLNEKGTTIILTTHYLEEAEQLCRSIAIIDHGKIIENTSMKELLKKLNKETFVFDFEAELEDNIKLLSGFNIKQLDSTSMEIEISQKQSLNDIFALFNKKNISVKSMRNKSNRLEELFVSMVDNGQFKY
tara:strand:- start:278 stop:1207 length:930 start_codon:yes stop_codon:yes gene_type:complete